MAKSERIRERISGLPGSDYFQVRSDAGWRLVAVEWERESGEPAAAVEEEVPYGMKVAADCAHLVYDPNEMAVMMLMMELILQERGFVQIAAELNQQNFRRRDGESWGPIAVYNLLPRLIEVGPRMFSTEEWVERRQRIYKLIGARSL